MKWVILAVVFSLWFVLAMCKAGWSRSINR